MIFISKLVMHKFIRWLVYYTWYYYGVVRYMYLVCTTIDCIDYKSRLLNVTRMGVVPLSVNLKQSHTAQRRKAQCATTLIRHYNYSWNCVLYPTIVLWRSQPINHMCVIGYVCLRVNVWAFYIKNPCAKRLFIPL